MRKNRRKEMYGIPVVTLTAGTGASGSSAIWHFRIKKTKAGYLWEKTNGK